jgi:hypothetical protein
MTDVPHPLPHTVAIGGVGGSGTRVGAALLQTLGYYIGDDLNVSLDNLWFTLLFKRRAILMESGPDFESLVSLFWSRMSGATDFSDEQRARIFTLADDERLQHDRAWLRRLAYSLLSTETAERVRGPWGWKEPNTHIVIERIFELRPALRYIHFTRHLLDMAFSDNQNQLQTWGPILANRDVAIAPREALAYLCAVHRRATAFMRRYPERTLEVDFDMLCGDPEEHCGRIATFLGAELSNRPRTDFDGLVDLRRPARGRYKAATLAQFNPQDLAYVRELGYDLD